MKNEREKIEKRLHNMKNFYLKFEETIENLPEQLPGNAKRIIKDAVLGDVELKKLMDGIDSNRPPRIFLTGRTGSGKSSLINAICGVYTAKVSDVKSGTPGMSIYHCKIGDRVVMDICDTRGLAESESLNDEISAEDLAISDINKFSPDVAILVLNATHRDEIDTDSAFLKKLSDSYKRINGVPLPLVVVINKADEVSPSRFKNPLEYPLNKKQNIAEIREYFRQIIVKSGLEFEEIISVSSLIDWMTPNGIEIDSNGINSLSESEIFNLQISFDGRFQIEKLVEVLIDSIQDNSAKMGLRMATRLNEVIKRVANQLTITFSGIAAAIAATPIPIADIYVLILLQSTLVTLIASLSGREISIKSAREFVLSMGGVAGAGLVFREIARIAVQQGSKFLNILFPGAGSAISSGVAAIGTKAIGSAAISYYLEDSSIKEAKSKFIKENKKTV